MAESLMRFADRRRRNIAALVLVSLLLWFLHSAYAPTLYRLPFFSGWILLASVALAAIYNLRKKIPVLPLAPAATWLQLHAYTGFFALVVFGFHTGFSLPNGMFETTLWLIFVIVALTGMVGLFWSRTFPKRLNRGDGEEVLLERIPQFVNVLRKEAEQVVVEAAEKSGSTLIGDYYREDLAKWFSGPADRWPHVVSSVKKKSERLSGIDSLARYVDVIEEPYLDQLRSLVLRKLRLDEHYALQSTLKLWLFVHVPFTAVLVVLAIIHLVAVYAFSG